MVRGSGVGAAPPPHPPPSPSPPCTSPCSASGLGLRVQSWECPAPSLGPLCSPPKAARGKGCPLYPRWPWGGVGGRPTRVAVLRGAEVRAALPTRVSGVRRGASVRLLGSIHPFPSKEFFPELRVSLGFFTLSFFILFPVRFSPALWAVYSCPTPCPPHTGGPHASPLPACGTARGNPALTEA